jgi:signal transduction histidine kinase/phage shock protein PspC (stress-responsive transcriptional regulator)
MRHVLTGGGHMGRSTAADPQGYGDRYPGSQPAAPWFMGGPVRRRRHRHWWHGPRTPGPLRRSRDDRLIGGVAGGVAGRLGIDPTVVRIGFVLGALASGFGISVYVLGWLLLPAEGDDSSIASRALHDFRGIALALAVVPAVVVVLVLASALGAGWLGSWLGALGIGGAGLVLVWRNVGDHERDVVVRLARPLSRLGITGTGTWRGVLVRVVVGLAVVGGGTVLLLLHSNRAVLRPLGGVLLVVAGAVVIFGPWWLHVVRDLFAERQARALAEERAELSARVHDSVLQTLALIQRRADDPQQVVKLARAQERELRSWLFDRHAPSAGDAGASTVAEAVSLLEREVEERYDLSVESVVVGDCPLDDHLLALVDAGREATVNAAKWSGSQTVSVFAEVEPSEVSMFVRDRGVGFDPDGVASDRRGLTESIHGRMARHGGTADVRSSPGGGTEVVLRMPRQHVESNETAAT